MPRDHITMPTSEVVTDFDLDLDEDDLFLDSLLNTSSPRPQECARPQPNESTSTVSFSSSPPGADVQQQHPRPTAVSSVSLDQLSSSPTVRSPAPQTQRVGTQAIKSSALQSILTAPKKKKAEIEEHVQTLTGKVDKLLLVLSPESYGEPAISQAIKDLVTLVEELFAKAVNIDSQSAKANLDALGTRIWNASSFLKADAEHQGVQNASAFVGCLRRQSCLLLFMGRIEPVDVECAQRIVLTCAMAATELLLSGQKDNALGLLEMAAQQIQLLEGALPDEEDQRSQSNEAICAYYLARYQLCEAEEQSIALFMLEKAIGKCLRTRPFPPYRSSHPTSASCRALKEGSWTTEAVFHAANRAAIAMLQKDETAESSAACLETLGEGCTLLALLHSVFDSRGESDKARFQDLRRKNLRLLARAQWRVAKLTGRLDCHLAAEHSMRECKSLASAHQKLGEASQVGVLLRYGISAPSNEARFRQLSCSYQ